MAPEDPDAGRDMTWMRPDPGYLPTKIDTSKPNIARVYDARLGGKDNFAVDRAVAEHMSKVFPDGGKAARNNRALLGRAVRYMAAQGISQFLDLGSGLPTVQNTHQIAQAANPGARVVYVDNDPMVLSHGRALLAENASTTVVTADLREPGKIMALPEITGFLDLARPVGLILNAVLHYVLDEEDPYGIVDHYKELLPPGSYLLITQFCNESDASGELVTVLQHAFGQCQPRSRGEITRFFDGFDLVPPGVVHLVQWRPEEPVSQPLGFTEMLGLSGVARKPLPLLIHSVQYPRT